MRSKTAERSIADLPGPRRWPLMGSAHRLLPQSRAHLVFEEWSRCYGPIYRVHIGPSRIVAIGDGEAINEILRDRPQGYRRSRRQSEVIEEMASPKLRASGDLKPGVFTAEGEDWKRQRRLIVTALNTNHLHRYFEIVRLATERLHRRLLEAAQDEHPIAISTLLTSFTVDVTSALALGHDLNTLERGDSELQGHIHRVMTMTARRIGFPIPYWRRIKLPADRALDRSLEKLYEAVEGFVEGARSRLEARPERYAAPENLLEGMLAAQKAEGAFSDAEIVSNVFTILLAGEDTTAHTLGWTVSLLATRPDIQVRLATEASEVFGDEPFSAAYEPLEDLAYTEAVLRESMRLKSVSPLLVVDPLEDKLICGTTIPAGTQLLLLLRHATQIAAGRSEEFYPERWLEDSDDTRAPKSLSFGAGPRFCPGRNLAFLESKAALAMIARNFELELDESGGQVQEAFDFAMVPKGLRVRLRERSSAGSTRSAAERSSSRPPPQRGALA